MQSLVSRKKKSFIGLPAPLGYVPGLGRGYLSIFALRVMTYPTHSNMFSKKLANVAQALVSVKKVNHSTQKFSRDVQQSRIKLDFFKMAYFPKTFIPNIITSIVLHPCNVDTH